MAAAGSDDGGVFNVWWITNLRFSSRCPVFFHSWYIALRCAAARIVGTCGSHRAVKLSDRDVERDFSAPLETFSKSAQALSHNR